MGPPRKCNQNKSLSTVSDNNKKSIARSVKKKKSSKKEDIPFQPQKTSTKKPNIFSYLNSISYGHCLNTETKTFTKSCLVSHVQDLSHTQLFSEFQRRVTAIEWHPKYPWIFVAGSKGGELLYRNLVADVKGSTSSCYSLPGIGPGGSITGVKFTLDDLETVYTASITGKIRQETFDHGDGTTIISTNSYQNWFTSLDVCRERRLLLAGDCKGNGILLSTDDRKKVWPHFKRLHKGKVSHIEFCPLDVNLFLTASIDHTVKIWDLRNLSRDVIVPKPLHTFTHLKGVNSAYFSPSNRQSLLTTDQNCELRVYKGPNWSDELIIKHPHRHFQHITPIKAMWHPLDDVIVVGRYPDDDFKPGDARTIDYIDGSTGDILKRVKSETGGIVGLNAFNITGDCLASASGSSIAFKSFPNPDLKNPIIIESQLD